MALLQRIQKGACCICHAQLCYILKMQQTHASMVALFLPAEMGSRLQVLMHPEAAFLCHGNPLLLTSDGNIWKV